MTEPIKLEILTHYVCPVRSSSGAPAHPRLYLNDRVPLAFLRELNRL
jgi:hypothetical protein